MNLKSQEKQKPSPGLLPSTAEQLYLRKSTEEDFQIYGSYALSALLVILGGATCLALITMFDIETVWIVLIAVITFLGSLVMLSVGKVQAAIYRSQILTESGEASTVKGNAHLAVGAGAGEGPGPELHFLKVQNRMYEISKTVHGTLSNGDQVRIEYYSKPLVVSNLNWESICQKEEPIWKLRSVYRYTE